MLMKIWKNEKIWHLMKEVIHYIFDHVGKVVKMQSVISSICLLMKFMMVLESFFWQLFLPRKKPVKDIWQGSLIWADLF